MTLDMLFANIKADDKQNLANKADDRRTFTDRMQAMQDLDNRMRAMQADDKQADDKQTFANRMQVIQEHTVNTAWASFKEKVEALPEGTPAEDVEKVFKKCCDVAIAAMLLTTAIMI